MHASYTALIRNPQPSTNRTARRAQSPALNPARRAATRPRPVPRCSPPRTPQDAIHKQNVVAVCRAYTAHLRRFECIVATMLRNSVFLPAAKLRGLLDPAAPKDGSPLILAIKVLPPPPPEQRRTPCV